MLFVPINHTFTAIAFDDCREVDPAANGHYQESISRVLLSSIPASIALKPKNGEGLDTKTAKDVIGVIRNVRDERVARLPDHPDAAYDQWLFNDGPFVNELCLMLLVAIRHQVERELVGLSARVTGHAKEIDGNLYRQRVSDERAYVSKSGWKNVIKNLRLDSFTEWDGSLKTLQMLANCYKHDPSPRPGRDLLNHLNLDAGLTYAPLPESHSFREGLAVSLSLPSESDFCDITEEFLARAARFLTDVEKQPGLSPVKRGPISWLDPEH